MRVIGYKNFIVALLLLVFTSQSIIALIMFRQLESQSPSSKMLDMDHSMMGMDHTTMNDDKKTDCCKTLGHCFLGNCSLASLEQSFFLLPFVLSLAASYFTVTARPSRLISSLYRPPISL
jgi:hypothetical protein